MKSERLPAPPCPLCGQETKGFSPIVLTIETEKEATFLWHYLNNNPTRSFGDYLRENEITMKVSSIKTTIWKAIHQVFPAEWV